MSSWPFRAGDSKAFASHEFGQMMGQLTLATLDLSGRSRA
jgi:hypothetical protein